jgi:hypothetical protein
MFDMRRREFITLLGGHFAAPRSRTAVCDGQRTSQRCSHAQMADTATLLATNLGWSLYAERADWRLRILSASGTKQLITGDPPTSNLRPADNDNGLARLEITTHYVLELGAPTQLHVRTSCVAMLQEAT